MPNPIPSTDVADFLENVKDFDSLMNGAGTYTDRFGKARLTVDEFFRRTGYEVPVAFASGIAVSRVTQTVTYSGVTYHALATAIPFTTTGTFNPAQWELISGVSRQELGAEYGSSLVGAATYAQLRAYAGDATRIQVGGRTNYFDGADGVFVRTGSAADNDGTVLVDALGRSWERQFSGPAKAAWFGAVANGIADDSLAIQKAVDYVSANGMELYFDNGVYKHTATIVWKNGAKYSGSNVNVSNTIGAVFSYVGTDDAHVINNPINSSTFASIQFNGLTFLCNSLSSGKALFYDTGSTYLYIEHCKFNFAGAGSFGLVLHQTEVAKVSNNIFEAIGNIGLGALIRLADGPVLKHPTAIQGYTNRITITDNQINPALGGSQAIGIWDDGGIVHKYADNNLNGGSISIYLLKPYSVIIEGNEIEGYTTAAIACGEANAGITGLRIVGNYMLAVPAALSFANSSVAEITYTDNVISVLGGGPCELNFRSGNPNAKIFATNNREVSAGNNPYNNYLQPHADTVSAMAVAGSTTAGVHGYSGNTMTWRTAGDLCFFNAYIALSSKDPSMAGAVRLVGLPFPARSANAQYTAVSVAFMSNITMGAGYTQLSGIIHPGNNFVDLVQGGSGVPVFYLDASAIAGTTQIMVSGVYPI